MSTFLELAQTLHINVGALGNPPSTVVSQGNENARMVRWIAQADMMVQTLWEDWKFLQDFSFSSSTIVDVRDLAAPPTVARWDLATFMIDGDPFVAEEYDDVRGEVFDLLSRDKPSRVIVMPDNTLRFDPIPDATYTVTADHYRQPVKLLNDGDVSAVPAEFHDTVILGRAIMLYGNFENAAEAKEQGLELYNEFIGRLESVQLVNQDSARYRGNGSTIQVSAR